MDEPIDISERVICHTCGRCVGYARLGAGFKVIRCPTCETLHIVSIGDPTKRETWADVE